MQLQLREKQRELLELQRKKLELELANTKKQIQQQEQQICIQTASVQVIYHFFRLLRIVFNCFFFLIYRTRRQTNRMPLIRLTLQM